MTKAEKVVAIDIGVSLLGDYMVIASGRSDRHVGPSPTSFTASSSGFAACLEGHPQCDWC
jgi:ribosome-associated protein